MRYISILLTLLSFHSFSQQKTFNRFIAWEKNKSIEYFNKYRGSGSDQQIFYFKNAFFDNNENLFPYYTELIEAANYFTAYEIFIDNPVFAPLQITDYEKVANIDILPEEISFSSTIKYLQKKPQIFLKLLPLRRNHTDGKIEKLVSFSIRIETSVEEKNDLNVSSPLKKSTLISNENTSFAGSSVLNSGIWFKVSVGKTGIYKLKYEDLVNMGVTNPDGLRVYGNGGKMLPLMNNLPHKDDLQEIPLYLEKGADGVFGAGDFVLFYAQGPITWQFDSTDNIFFQKIHDYSNYACYFLTSSFGEGKRVKNEETVSAAATQSVTTFDAYDFNENELYNLIESGRQWFGKEITNSPFDTSYIFTNLDVSQPVKIKVNAVSRSSTNKTFTLKVNNQEDNITIGPVNIDNSTGVYAKQASKISFFNATNDLIPVTVDYNKTASTDRGWIDYLTINARRKLVLNGDVLLFRDINSVEPGNIAEFKIENVNSQTLVWDVSDINNTRNIETYTSGDVFTFKVKTDSLKEFIAFNKNAEYSLPFLLGQIENQDLHSIQPHKLVIVTHPKFIKQAEKIADFHRQKDNFSVFVTTTEKIYNEFSSGIRDVSAIRNFVRMLYQRSGTDENALKYLLLFGDGSYNNRLDHELNPNYIPTYQSENSLNPTESYVTDDFFGFLDDEEGGSYLMADFLLDIGIGRIPVKDTSEANSIVNKILLYNTSASMLDWRNNLLFLGDDDYDNLTFMETSSKLGDYISTNYPQYFVKKVLLDAYKITTSASGNRYPEVKRILLDNFNKGILLFNYLGHGGEKGITAEHVLMKEDLAKLKNKFHPVFITATCEFSRFDWIARDDVTGNYIEETTAGEVALLNPVGGAIALLTTTRLVYIDQNDILNNNFYKYAFTRDENDNRLRLGDIAMKTKIATGGSNQLNFTLLGDPALAMAYPEILVTTDSINGKHITEPLDTLKAFSKVTVSGSILTRDSLPVNDFNGVVFPSVLDKRQLMRTLSNSGNDPVSFYIQENIVYHGKATVTNGKFHFSFIVPKDVNYSIGDAKITYYAEDSVIDGHGYFDKVAIGGTSDEIIQDHTGPEIKLYLNDENFESGGITDNNPVILARIWDENGINTTSIGIGHDITGILDGDVLNQINLNPYYLGEIDDYQSGTVIYNLNDLEAGLHTLEIKVWDIFNNSSTASIEFFVKDEESLVIDKAINYPNPMRNYTYFRYDHNKPEAELKIKIDIYDLSGRLVHSIAVDNFSGGYRSVPIEWDGKDSWGNKLPNGVYPYRIRVETNNGDFAEQFRKLIILN